MHAPGPHADMPYEESEVTLAPGESLLFHSDGLVEAHNSQRQMFGFPRLREVVTNYDESSPLIEYLLADLARFTGADWEQEDDVTLLMVQRHPPGAEEHTSSQSRPAPSTGGHDWRTLDEFDVRSERGNERSAAERVAKAAGELGLTEERLERLKTAVAEATMNAMEHGNEYDAELPVSIRALASNTAISVHVTDQGGGDPAAEMDAPDLAAKLAGTETPRGWGLFLIKNLVDEINVTGDQSHHTVELILHLEGDTVID